MKFEKHLKNTGIYGVIIVGTDGAKYLRTGRYGNVMARIPDGAAPLSMADSRDLEAWIDGLVDGAEDLPRAELCEARIAKDGKAKDIRRIFRDVNPTGYGERKCMITQEAFALIERGDDVRIFDPSVDVEMPDDLEPIDEPANPEDYETVLPALLILDETGTVRGIVLDAGMWDE